MAHSNRFQAHAAFEKEDIEELYGHDLELADKLKDFIFDKPRRMRAFDRDPEADFMLNLDREKAKIFKKQWHAAEFDSVVRQRWYDVRGLIDELRAIILLDRDVVVHSFEILHWLGVGTWEHRLVVKDIWDATAAMNLFFPPYVSRSDPSKNGD